MGGAEIKISGTCFSRREIVPNNSEKKASCKDNLESRETGRGDISGCGHLLELKAVA